MDFNVSGSDSWDTTTSQEHFIKSYFKKQISATISEKTSKKKRKLSLDKMLIENESSMPKKKSLGMKAIEPPTDESINNSVFCTGAQQALKADTLNRFQKTKLQPTRNIIESSESHNNSSLKASSHESNIRKKKKVSYLSKTGNLSNPNSNFRELAMTNVTNSVETDKVQKKKKQRKKLTSSYVKVKGHEKCDDLYNSNECLNYNKHESVISNVASHVKMDKVSKRKQLKKLLLNNKVKNLEDEKCNDKLHNSNEYPSYSQYESVVVNSEIKVSERKRNKLTKLSLSFDEIKIPENEEWKGESIHSEECSDISQTDNVLPKRLFIMQNRVSKQRNVKKGLKEAIINTNKLKVKSDLSKNSDEYKLRDEVESTLMFQKIKKLLIKAPYLDPNFVGTETATEQSTSEFSDESSVENLSDDFLKEASDDNSEMETVNDNQIVLNTNKTVTVGSYSVDGQPNKLNLSKSNKKQNTTIETSEVNYKVLPCNNSNNRNDSNKTEKSKTSISFMTKIRAKLQASKFRYLNEKLYTETGANAFKYFQENTDEFHDYHIGYSLQVSKWPKNPVDKIITELQNMSKGTIIADLGCGDAKIARMLSDKTVHSFDLVALNEFVTACDISKVPLPKESVDVVVFCLSLMGTNLKDYLHEAHRILKLGGILKIAEVESRIQNTDILVKKLISFGFTLKERDTKHKLFVFLDLTKVKKKLKNANLQNITLKPCLYKKR